MTLTIRYLGQARGAAGRSSETIQAEDGCTAAALLRALADRHPGLRGLLLTAAGEPSPSVLVFVGDDQAETTRRLRDGDAVTVLTPMAGG
jgi:molybdopterin converting factor small subunit